MISHVVLMVIENSASLVTKIIGMGRILKKRNPLQSDNERERIISNSYFFVINTLAVKETSRFMIYEMFYVIRSEFILLSLDSDDVIDMCLFIKCL